MKFKKILINSFLVLPLILLAYLILNYQQYIMEEKNLATHHKKISIAMYKNNQKKVNASYTEQRKEVTTKSPSITKTNVIDKPTIVVIIGGLGLSKSSTELAMSLPSNITFGLSPYANNIDSYGKMASESGHDVLLYLPMEPVNYPLDDDGPYSLLTSISLEENTKRLNNVLSSITKFVGVYSTNDEKFTLSNDNLTWLISNFKRLGIIYLYGGTKDNNMVSQIAKEYSYPYIFNDIYIDEDISEEMINFKLKSLEELAIKKGYAVGIGNPYPLTLDLVKKWIPSLVQKNINLVPISNIYDMKKTNK